MKEYEYSFKVDSINPYINYCINNNYKKVSIFKENRVIYENKINKNIIARLTINENNETILDFKNICNEDGLLKISKESSPIKITTDNIQNIKSVLDELDFYETANNIRTRYIYELDGVKLK